MANSLRIRGMVLTDQGSYPLATDYHQESLALNREIGDQQGIAESLLSLGAVTYFQGYYPLADDYFQQSLAINRETGSLKGIANTLTFNVAHGPVRTLPLPWTSQRLSRQLLSRRAQANWYASMRWSALSRIS